MPAPHPRRKGIYVGRGNDRHIYWLSNTVRHILENLVYVGHMALGKQRADPHAMHNGIRQPKENWVITYNTHEPIIAQSDFDAVQELIWQSKQKHWKYAGQADHAMSETENIFSGVAFCADCGRAYTRMITCSKDRSKHYFRYICSYCKTHRPDKAQLGYMGEQELTDAVYAGIMKQIEICADTRMLVEKTQRSEPAQQRKEAWGNEARRLKEELGRLPARRLRMYDDFCDGLLDEKDYRLFGERYERDEQTIHARLAAIEAESSRLEPAFVEQNAFISQFERFQNEQALTREMLAALVSRIEVGGDSKVHIAFRYRDEYAKLEAMLIQNGALPMRDDLERSVKTA